MGAQERLTVARDDTRGAEESDPPPRRTVPWWAFGGVTLLGMVAGVWGTRSFYLWLDDFVFIGQARRFPFGLDYLTEGLYQHFSPVSRLVDAGAVGFLPDHTWAARGFMLLLLAIHLGAVVLVCVVLLGRTRIGLLAAASLATSLAVLPLVNWWTAGLNILPSVTGSALCLAGAVALGRGGSRWWGVLSVAGYLVGVLDYETAMLLPAYALAWVLLFPGEEGRLPLRTQWRRTGWLWLALAVVGAAALVNYRLNYYVKTPGAPVGQYAEALVRALFQLQLPLILGFSDLDDRLFTWAGVLLSVLVVVLLLLRARRRPAMWKGLAFAAAGFLLPTAALVLNRVGEVGQVIVTLPYYYALSTLLVVLGVAAALAEPEPAPASVVAGPPTGRWSRERRLAPVALLVVVSLAWLHSVGPTSRIVFVAGHRLFPDEPVNTQAFVIALTHSAREVERRDPSATLLDGDVPDSVVWSQYAPYNRLGVVAPLIGIRMPIDDPDGSPYVALPDGRIRPAAIDWRERVSLAGGQPTGLAFSGTQVHYGPKGGCFTTTSQTRLEWALPQAVHGRRLVVRALVTTDAATPERVVVAGADLVFAPANFDVKSWPSGSRGSLDTVAATRVARVGLDSFAAGRHVCLSGLEVGVVTLS